MAGLVIGLLIVQKLTGLLSKLVVGAELCCPVLARRALTSEAVVGGGSARRTT
jgi:hypothetical protein